MKKHDLEDLNNNLAYLIQESMELMKIFGAILEKTEQESNG